MNLYFKLSVYCLLVCLLGVATNGVAQQRTPRQGLVIDASERIPLPGVTVNIKGRSGGGVVTDTRGRFSIQAAPSDTLVLNSIGYNSREIRVGNQTQLTISLEPSITELDDVIVVGYGTVSREDLTGSVAEVNMEDLNRAPVASYEEALAGRVAGVQVSSNEGQPGTEMNIVIRGGNSLTQSNAPLYVIDGFPIEDPGTASINPDDIKSINILKDASATAIYGSRGANGVVIIETKRGEVGKPAISYSGYAGINRVTKRMDMMSPYEFVKYQLEMDDEVSTLVYLTRPNRQLEDYKTMEGISWQDLMFRDAFVQDHRLSVSGGTKETQYRLSGSLTNREGVIINSGSKRQQIRTSLDQKINSRLDIGATLNFTAETNEGGLSSEAQGVSTGYSTYQMYRVWGYRPITGIGTPILDEVIDEEEDVDFADARVNPIISAENEIRRQTKNTLFGNAYARYEILPNLLLNVRGGLNRKWYKDEAFYNSKTARGYPSINNPRKTNGSFRHSGRIDWVNENTLEYTAKDDNQRLKLIAGMTIQQRKSDRFGYASELIPNESLGLSGLDNGTPGPMDALLQGHTLVSYLGRAEYNYRSKYMLTATFRADGSSKFAPKNRWAYFPSAGIAWNIANERFMEGLPFVSTAKVRASYGTTGNNRIGDFTRYSSLSMNPDFYYSFQNGAPSPSVIANRFGNEDLRWETTTQTDIGIDLGLFKRRLSLTADIYRKVTDDLLLNANVPYSTGYTTIYKNVGSISNEGLEITLSTVNVANGDFTWSTDFNIAFNRNKVLALADNEEKILSDVSWTSTYNNQPLYMAKLGQSAASFIGYVWDGVYQYTDFDQMPNGTYVLKSTVPTNGMDRGGIQPGDIKYRDFNADGIVNEKDMAVIGRGLPVHMGGFNNNFEYKGFSLNVFFQWSYGNDIFNTNRIMFEGNSETRRNLNQYASYINRWTPDNPTNDNYRSGGQGIKGLYTSRTIEDGSFLRLKTVALSYALSHAWLERLSLGRAEVYASAQNLHTWTSYSGMDPEVSVRHSTLTPGFDYSAYPYAKTFVFGVKIGL